MKKLILAVASFAPAVAFGAAAPTFTGVTSLIKNVIGVINSLVPLLFAIAIIYFFWGLVTFVRSAGDAKTHDAGRQQMIYGIIALAVMLSVYGLIGWLQGALGFTGSETVVLPSLPTV